MKYKTFKKLHSILRPKMQELLGENKTAEQQETNRHRYVPNGSISTSVRLGCALRYFSGGSPYNLMTTYQIGRTDVFKSVWCVVRVVNTLPYFNMEYPTRHEEQSEIAAGFQAVS